MQLHYLEIVAADRDAVCAAYAAAHGVQFGDPDGRLGQARTATLAAGAMVGVRAPLHQDEQAVVRPYWLVGDIQAAVAAVLRCGGEFIHPPLEIPGLGCFAIYSQCGTHHGLWQL